MGNGRLLKLSTRNPGPRNSAHSLPDSVAVTFSMAPGLARSRDRQRNDQTGLRGIGEVRDPEPAHDGSGVGVVVVEEVAERVRRAVQNVLQRHVLIDESSGWPCPIGRSARWSRRGSRR